MTILKYQELHPQTLRPGVERRQGYTDNLMITVIDFNDGPTNQPDPLHSHPHEQVTYVAAGEILFVMNDEATHLKPGDLVLIPSGVPHAIQQLTEHVRLVDCFTPIRQDFLP